MKMQWATQSQNQLCPKQSFQWLKFLILRSLLYSYPHQFRESLNKIKVEWEFTQKEKLKEHSSLDKDLVK